MPVLPMDSKPLKCLSYASCPFAMAISPTFVKSPLWTATTDEFLVSMLMIVVLFRFLCFLTFSCSHVELELAVAIAECYNLADGVGRGLDCGVLGRGRGGIFLPKGGR